MLRLGGVVMVPEDKAGIVTKKFVLFGADSKLPDGAIVALKGEAGVQAEMLAPGIHYGKYPWQYAIELIDFITIPQGKIGVVQARDGKPLVQGRILAKHVDCDSFQDAKKFLENGGERGAQITTMSPGTYRINSLLFTVTLADVIDVPDNQVGIVTTKEGTPLQKGEIAGVEIAGHNSFQDGQAFLAAGGNKGLQEQVILAGRYYINPLFAEVETKPMTDIPIGSAGVVVSYVGKAGTDVTGDNFKHGNIVSRGEKGVWSEVLDPGKYPINPFIMKIELVPTTNVVLNWATGKTESHQLDKNLSTITVRSSDGFTFNLDVSQIIHVPRVSAPKVIARFGNMGNLVTQVLEPTIGNYFRNAAQSSDVIEFLKKRSERQGEAKKSISAALGEYDVQAVDTLIGDIVPPNELMKTLTDRKLAEQQEQTYTVQQKAETSRQELNKSKALADIQPKVVEAERGVQIAEMTAASTVKQAEGAARSRKIQAQGEADAKNLNAAADANAKNVNAEADANVFRLVGKAEAEKIEAIGTAEAEVTKRKIESIGAANFAVIEVGRALAVNKVQLVPQIQVNGSGEKNNGLVDVLLGSLLKDKVVGQ